MEEIKKSKTIETEQVLKTELQHQVMTALAANTIREIVRLANEGGIRKEDIISLLKENGQFVLVYYK